MQGTCLRLVVTGLVGVAMLAGGPPAAAAAAATLDPGFGDGGLLQFPVESAETALGAAAQDGGLAVSGGTSVQLLGPTGGAGEAFGGVGSLTVPAAVDRTFALGGFTVDAKGRLLVVGSSLYPQAENPSPTREGGGLAFAPAVSRVLRFLPSGGLDPSFGQGGVVETDLGLPAPRGTEGRPLGLRPAVRATGIATGPQGQIVVTGDTVVHLGRACGRNAYAPGVFSAGFVARLGEDGTLDAAFGRGGVAGGHRPDELPLAAGSIKEPVIGPAGTVTYRSSAVNPCSRETSHFGIGQLTATGKARGAFGKKGATVGTYRALAAGPDGTVVALAEPPRRRGENFRARVTEIAPDGKPERSFGKGGSTTVRFGARAEPLLSSITVDDQGWVLVGGVMGTGKGEAIVLLRLSTAGRPNASFGQGGKVITKVSGLYGPSALFFDGQGRLVTDELWKNALKGRGGLVVARYLLSN
jgi:hypothetical protein